MSTDRRSVLLRIEAIGLTMLIVLQLAQAIGFFA